MLAKVTLKCWPSYVIFLGAEDGQHFNFKNAWLCRENQILKKNRPQTWPAFSPYNIYIYIYIYIYEPFRYDVAID